MSDDAGVGFLIGFTLGSVLFCGLIGHQVDYAWREACRKHDVMRYNEQTGVLEWRVKAEKEAKGE